MAIRMRLVAERLSRQIPRVALLCVWVTCAVSIGGCLSLRTTGAANADDLAAEERYKSAYAKGEAGLQEANVPFLPGPGNPGVCNIGGDRQGCVDADLAAANAFRALISELDEVGVPPRFVDGDRLLRLGIAGMLQGLGLRDHGLIESDNDAFAEHKVVLEEATRDLEAAHKAFPADNWPFLP